MSNIITQKEVQVGMYGKETVEVTKRTTLTQNDGFKTLEIIKNADRLHGIDAEITTADIFVRDSMDDMWSMLDMLTPGHYDYKCTYSMVHGRHHSDTKFMKSEKECLGQIQRKMQTDDYRTRELLIVIVRHEPSQWCDHETFSVFCEDRASLARKAKAKLA
jgi:hypothetical protein